MKKEEIIEIQKNLIEIYEKEFRKAGVKYPDDYQTTFIGKKIIKLKSELAELSGQEDKISDEDIEMWAELHRKLFNDPFFVAYKKGLMAGAQAMRDGQIKTNHE